MPDREQGELKCFHHLIRIRLLALSKGEDSEIAQDHAQSPRAKVQAQVREVFKMQVVKRDQNETTPILDLVFSPQM